MTVALHSAENAQTRQYSPHTPTKHLIPLWLAAPTAGVAGLLLDLASPSLSWWPLAFVSVMLLLATLIGRSLGGGFLIGLIYGASFYFVHLAWAGRFLGDLPWLALASLQTVLFAILTIPIVLAYCWAGHSGTRTWKQLAGVPLLVGGVWVTRELIMGSWPYGGFPWVRIGMIQADGPFREVASWGGVTGLSFLVVTICAMTIQWVRAGGIRWSRGVIPVALITVGLALVPQFQTAPAGTLSVGWVQGNGPAAYFDTREPDEVLRAQVAATQPLIGQPVDIVAWPEGSVDSDPLNNPATAAILDSVVRATGAPLLMNAATARGDHVYNTSILWTANPSARQMHDKVNPVPFGEYVPDRWFYEQIVPNLIGLIGREYTPGTNPPIITLGDVGIGLAICFDVIYDSVIREGAREGAQLYIFQTNNADFRGTDENLQQLAFARMRAIETGRTVINVSTVGTSQVIRPDGKTTETIGVDVAAGRISTVELRTGLTPAVVVGRWLERGLAYASCIALVYLGVARSRARRKLRSDIELHGPG